MHKNTDKVSDADFVSDIVIKDYQTAEIFQRYGIDFYDGEKLPLNVACKNKSVNLEEVKKALNEVCTQHFFSTTIQYNEWSIDFLLDYIMNVHHDYLKRTLPVVEAYINRSIETHRQTLPLITDLKAEFDKLRAVILPKLEDEENVIFPYIRQIAHAYQNKEPYARLLVRTMRKPLEAMMLHNHEFVNHVCSEWKRLTANYHLPADASAWQLVLYNKLQELEKDLMLHIYLENNVLYPKTIAMEKELLMQPV